MICLDTFIALKSIHLCTLHFPVYRIFDYRLNVILHCGIFDVVFWSVLWKNCDILVFLHCIWCLTLLQLFSWKVVCWHNVKNFKLKQWIFEIVPFPLAFEYQNVHIHSGKIKIIKLSNILQKLFDFKILILQNSKNLKMGTS